MNLSVASRRRGTTDAVVYVHGKRQVVLEWGAAARDLLLTMGLHCDGGRHVTRRRRCDGTFNDNNRFACAHGTREFTLTDEQPGHGVLQATIADRDNVVNPVGTFCRSTGGDLDIVRDAGADSAGGA